MYNSDIPNRAELPTTGQLVRSTIAALLAALVISITIVLPAEYAIDPTGIGRVLQLTQMGEIKRQLAEEAAADRIRDQQQRDQQQREREAPPRSSQSSPWRGLAALIVPQARAAEAVLMAQSASRTDETVIVLQPAQGIEYKIDLLRGAQIEYSWRTEGGPVNYDMHGTPRGGGRETSYKTARGVTADEGVMTAGFDGSHGWFFRNRGTRPVTVRLRTTGIYTEIRRVN
jgi:hypothetical protein